MSEGYETGQPLSGEREAVLLRDADIRDALCDYLEERSGRVRFFDELEMGSSRADIVMVTEEGLTGVEIKSDADTYARLPRQVRDYDRYFDRNLLVVGSRHAHHAAEHIPEHWGILVAEREDGRMDFYELRSPKPNPKDPLRAQLKLLWRRELLHLQTENGLHKYAGKRRSTVESYVKKSVPGELLKPQILAELFERDYTIFD